MHAAAAVRSVEGAGGLVSRMPCRLRVGFLAMRPACRFPCCGVARNRNGIPTSGVPAAAFTSDRGGPWCSSLGSTRTRGHTLLPSSTATSSSSRELALRADRRNATACWVGRRSSNRGCGRSKARPEPAPCWRSSSSVRARRSLTCRPRSRRGRGCWTRVATTRPTATMPVRPRSSRYGIATCGPWRSRITRRCCGCWRAVTTS